MKIRPVLSIIVPVYNMECFIERCLRSLFEQDIPLENFEIIAINDGSQDRSKEIIVGLQHEFRNLILINQRNKGVSTARNVGISFAKGKYILFIDPDDYVITNSIGKLIEKAETSCLDVLYLSLLVYDNKGNYLGKTDYTHLEGKILTGIETYYISRGKKEKDPDRIVGILINKVFLQKNGLSFLDGVPYLEDGLFGGKTLCHAKRCAFDFNPFYIRLINPGSASNSNLYNTSIARNGFIKAALDLRDFAKSSDMNIDQKGLINHLIAKFVLSAVISTLGSKKIKDILLVRQQIQQLGFKKLKSNGLMSNKSYVKSYNCSFWVFIMCYILGTRMRTLIIKVKGQTNERVIY